MHMDLFTAILAFTSGMIWGLIQVLLAMLMTVCIYWVVGCVFYMIWSIVSPDNLQRFEWWLNRKIKNIKKNKHKRND